MGFRDKWKIVAKQTLLVAVVALVLCGSFALAYTALALSERGEKNSPVALESAPTERPGNKNNADPTTTATQGNADADASAASPAASPQDGTALVPKTIPAGILSAEEAIAIAQKGYQDYFGLDAQDCVVIDTFSHTLATVYGSGELYEPLLLQKAFAGKKMLLVLLYTSESDYGEPAEARTTPPVWSFQLLPDGADDGNILAGFSINAETGDVIAGGLVTDEPEGQPYPKDTLKQMTEAARQYVGQTGILGQAAIVKVENVKTGPEVSVTLSDGRVIVVKVNGNGEVISFYVKGVWDSQEIC